MLFYDAFFHENISMIDHLNRYVGNVQRPFNRPYCITHTRACRRAVAESGWPVPGQQNVASSVWQKPIRLAQQTGDHQVSAQLSSGTQALSEAKLCNIALSSQVSPPRAFLGILCQR